MATPQYVDPQSIHNPTVGTAPPAAWGDAVRDGLEFVARPPGCVAFRGTSQTITNLTLTSLEFTSSDLRDTDDYHSPITSPELVTIPSGLGGWYLWYVRLRWQGDSAGSRNLYVMRNATVENVSLDLHGVSNTLPVTVTSVAQWDAGDEIQVQVYQGSGSDIDITRAEFGMFMLALP